MKKALSLLFLAVAYKDNQATQYTATSPPTGMQANMNLNSLGSAYAAKYGHSVTALIARETRRIIYDAAPKQYMDLKILSMKPALKKNSDEFFYHEMGFGRDPIILDTVGSDIAAGSSQSLPILNKQNVSKDMIVVYPDNSRGTITTVTPSGLGATIVVTSETGETLPLVPAGAAGTYLLAYHSPVEADSADSISNYSRFNTIERSNYIQMVVQAMRFGKMELQKYQSAGTLDNYLEMNKKRMYTQFRISLSNILWNGNKGEVTLASGQKAKTAGGIYPIMNAAGSARTSTTMANLPDALEELALGTEYGEYGANRFLYGTPKAIHYLSQQYKRDLTRYTPNDDIAKLGLEGVRMGSSNIIFVPMKRFEEPSCFPSIFRSKLFLLDNESISPCYVFPEEMGETLSRKNQGTLQNFTDTWISATHSIEFNNPLASGTIDITNLP